MSYEKQTWASGDVITAEKLNHIENGVAGSGGGGNFVVTFEVDYDGDTPTATADKTYSQISTAYSSGQNVVGHWNDNDVSAVWEIPLLLIDNQKVAFNLVTATAAGGSIAGFTSYEFDISNADVVTFTNGAYDF